MTTSRKVVEATFRVIRAIQDEGRRPDYHREIMRKHRAEWPTLWAALDELREALRGIKRG